MTGIFGRIGSGKTTLLDLLLTFATEISIDPRMAIYDRDRGMYPLVKALHGRYTVLKDGVPTGWQPLQLDPTRIYIAFVKRLLRVLAETTLNGEPLEQHEVDDLSAAIDAVMGRPSMIRRLTGANRRSFRLPTGPSPPWWSICPIPIAAQVRA